MTENEADDFLEAALADVSPSVLFPPVLFAPATYAYQCHANLVAGVECYVWCGHRAAVEFPIDYRE